jgi:TonB family protein
VCLNSSRRGFGVHVGLFLLFLATGPILTAADEKDPQAKDSKDSSGKTDEKAAPADPVYEPGGDVKSPKLVHYVEPAPVHSSKQAFIDGMVRLSTVVTVEGKPTELRVLRGLTGDEDRTAMDAVAQWRFQPGTKNGQPVNVRVTVEVEFHLL